MNAPIAGIDERVRRLPFKGREAVREALETAEWFAAHPPFLLLYDVDAEIATRRSLRGLPTWRLVTELQSLADQAEVGTEAEDEWVKAYAESITRELERRSDFTISEKAQASQHEMRALKELCVGETFVGIVGHYVEVTVVSGSYKYRCPIHGDDHPSGQLYPVEGKWHCFGCNRGGDVFDFLMIYGRLAFQEAIALLGKSLGIRVGRGHGG